MSSGFMQLWKNESRYRKFIEHYANQVQKSNTKKVDKQYAEDNYLNEFDFETIHKDYNNFINNKPLSNETGFGKGEPKVEVSDEEVNEPTKETNRQEVNLEQPQKSQREIEQEEAPYYETQQIPFHKLERNDIVYFQDDWFVVGKKTKYKAYIQNLYDRKIKTFRKNPTDMVEILTDESINQIINEFKDEGLEHKLPKTVQQEYLK